MTVTSICYVNESKEPQTDSPISPQDVLKYPYESYGKQTPPQSMAHYKPRTPGERIYYKRGMGVGKGYGVPPKRRILTIDLFHKRHDHIRRLLIQLGLETRERDAIFGLLRLYIHYGKTYPKAAQLASEQYISKRTFWRAVHKLRILGAIEVVNRYFNHKQISNVYRLDKLVVLIARYLAEHGQPFGEFTSQLITFFVSFWRDVWEVEINLSRGDCIKRKLLVGGW